MSGLTLISDLMSHLQKIKHHLNCNNPGSSKPSSVLPGSSTRGFKYAKDGNPYSQSSSFNTAPYTGLGLTSSVYRGENQHHLAAENRLLPCIEKTQSLTGFRSGPGCIQEERGSVYRRREGGLEPCSGERRQSFPLY